MTRRVAVAAKSDPLVKELRQVLGRMEAAFGLIPDAVAWTDREGLVRWCNAALERLLHRPRLDILGSDIRRILPLRDGDHPAARIAGGERSGMGRYEFGQRLLEIHWQSTRWEREDMLVFLIRDQTENQRTVDELAARKKADERFRLAVEASPSAMVMFGRDGRIVMANTQTERLFGYERRELIGRKIEQLLPERYHAEVPGRGESRGAEPEPRALGAGRDLFGLRKDGTEVPVELGLNPIEATEGLVLVSIIDITERKFVEEQARETARLEAAAKELEAFSYSVAHDLRAPLRHIDGFIQLLRQRLANELDARNRELLEKVSGAAKRLGLLIDELLLFSKTARTELRLTPVPLAPLVAETIAELSEGLGGRRVEWKVDALPDVECDAGMLKLVFYNLIGNALKFSRGRDPAVIEIGCVPGRPDETTLLIRDNGAGFDMRYADKLFGVFQRLHRLEEFEGTGIGLANVRRIIAKHGGRTWAEGEVGKGAVFYFTLPLPAKEGT